MADFCDKKPYSRVLGSNPDPHTFLSFYSCFQWSNGVIFISITIVLKCFTIAVLHILGFLTVSSLSSSPVPVSSDVKPSKALENQAQQNSENQAQQNSEFMIKQGRSPSVFSVDSPEGRNQVKNSPYMRHLINGQNRGAPGLAYQMDSIAPAK